MCEERPADWDRYLAAVLFAYRETPEDSFGFSPFEMLYERAVRGPVTILKELWTQEEELEEVQTTYQYVLGLRNRLVETCQFALDALNQSSQNYRRNFNKKAKQRQPQIRDKALLLLPTDNNKLLMQWKGPFQVIGKRGPSDFMLDVNGKSKFFHVNLLKKYTEREPQEQTISAGLY